MIFILRDIIMYRSYIMIGRQMESISFLLDPVWMIINCVM